jgi:tetrahydromethanopterin S-methyltransferase subunit A
MAIVAAILAAGMLERWGTGFVNGGILGAVIGLVIAVIMKCVRSGR